MRMMSIHLWGGSKADLIVTDPPYNVNIKNSKGMTIDNDNMEDDLFFDFLNAAFKTMYAIMKPGAPFYVWYASKSHIQFEQALNANELAVRQQLVWNKNHFLLGRQDYQWKHELCMYGWKDGAAHYFCEDRTQGTVLDDKKIELSKLKKDELLELLTELLGEKTPTTVLDYAKPNVNDLHPTMKPLELISRLIKNSSIRGDIVVDLFGGSGSTLMCCEQLGRKNYTMEVDPVYADVIIRRWEEFTGKKAVKVN